MHKVSINLVTWNGDKYIENCLNSVLAQTFKDFSIIIIDNGSSDQTLELINERFPHLRIVKHKENLGFSKAYNQTIHWSKAEYILCLNQDVVLEPTFLEKMVAFMDANPKVGSATGKIYRFQDDQKTKYIDSLGLKLFKNFRAIDYGSGEMDEGQFENQMEIFGVSGALPMFRTKALESVAFKKEFFDEDFFAYKEDVDLAIRMKLFGWKSWLVPKAIAFHDRTVSSPVTEMTKMQIAKNRTKKSKFANFYSYRNHLFSVYKNIPQFSLKFLWPIFWYESMKFAYILFLEPSSLKAFIHFIKKKKVFSEKRKHVLNKKTISNEEFSRWLS